MKQLILLLFAISIGTTYAQNMERVIEIRSYNLKPQSRTEFNRLFVEEALPMLKRWNIEVVSYGPSLHDENSYYLARVFTDIKDLERKEDAFYGSDDWKKGPRESVLALIESYVTIVVPEKTFDDPVASQHADELAQLSKLNSQFIRNYVNQDTVGHNKIIHPDFVCIQGNGTIVGRKDYMKNWATDYSKSKYTSFGHRDELIRIFGNMALVRSVNYYSYRSVDKVIAGSTIYTDTYVKERGRWWCVQAQITPQ